MYINITDNKVAKNKGSSGQLVNYLEKENRLNPAQEPEKWFNHLGQRYEPYEVRTAIDDNIAKLGKDDAKFFLINISPSQKELNHLKESFKEKEVSLVLKQYAVKVMDEYARNFSRAGINSSKDLVWFAKLEAQRYYTHNDKDVKSGARKRGDLKPGDQRHIQVIVSRKDFSNKIKLSPMNSSKGKNVEHSKKMGQFDRVAFKYCGEVLFDREFGFNRELKDTVAYANILKNGTLAQRKQLDILDEGYKGGQSQKEVIFELAQDVSKGLFQTSSDMLEKIGSSFGSFLDIMLEPAFVPVGAANTQEPKRKKKKRGYRQGQSIW